MWSPNRASDRKKWRPIKLLSTVLLAFSTLPAMAQAPLQTGQFSFTVSTSDPDPSDGLCVTPSAGDATCAHILVDVTVGGTTFTTLTTPSSFSATGFPGGSNVQSRIHDVPGDFVFGDANYNANMLANVFTDNDLNRYQQVDSNANLGSFTLGYATPVPATDSNFFLITERNGNNTQFVEAFDTNGISMGTVEVTGLSADYTDTGRNVGFTQGANIALIPLDRYEDVGDPSRQIQSFTITNATSDGGDFKAFIIGVGTSPAPVAVDDVVTATPSTPIVFNAIGNDTGTLDTASVLLTTTTSPPGSTLSGGGLTLTVPGEGVWTVNDPTNGSVTFTPEASFTSLPTPATYTVANTSGARSNEATLSATMAGSGTIAANNDGYTVNGTTGETTASVLVNDTLMSNPITNPADVNLTPLIVPTPTAGSLTLNGDGTITVGAGTTVGSYNITYQICEAAVPTNCDTAVATVAVFSTTTTLISEIEEDLERILEDDLAHTVTQQSNQISGYSADALDQLQRRTQDQCRADVNAQLAAENILFENDRAIVNAASDPILDRIAAILLTCPGSAFEIAGHTDSDASDAYNLDLSQRRAAAVLRALAARNVDTSGYVARGYGESQPIATNETEEGQALNRRVEFRTRDTEAEGEPVCEPGFRSLFRSFNMDADDDGTLADGAFLSETHNCATDQREVFEGTLSYIDTDNGQTQAALNLSYRREQYRDADSVFGVFAGLYGSQSDVNGPAEGDITGVGVNGGIYGANHLQGALFMDYYLGAALGRHSFDLDFERTLGTITATGDYTYLAGFAGAAISGEFAVGQAFVTPRAGFDYVFTPGSDVDVEAALGALTETGSLELDAISGGRIFAEFRGHYPLENGVSILFITPRVSCYQSLGNLDGVCGYGGSIGIETTEQANGLTYAVELSGEVGEDYGLGSLSASFERQMGIGTLSGGTDLSTQGDLRLIGGYDLQF